MTKRRGYRPSSAGWARGPGLHRRRLAIRLAVDASQAAAAFRSAGAAARAFADARRPPDTGTLRRSLPVVDELAPFGLDDFDRLQERLP